MCYHISADQPMGMNTVKNVNAKRVGGGGSLGQDAWNIKMQWAGQSCWREHSGDAVWRSLDWAKCRGQGRIIKRLEHTPSGTTEGRMGNINRELYLLGKARRWKHWLRLFCWLGGTPWFMCWWRSSIYCTKAVPCRQLKWDQTLRTLPAPPGRWEGGSHTSGARLWIQEVTHSRGKTRSCEDLWHLNDSSLPEAGKWHAGGYQGSVGRELQQKK